MPVNKYIIPVEEAAQILGIAIEAMKQILIQGNYDFGIALKYGTEKRPRYRYIIFRKRFEDFINGL